MIFAVFVAHFLCYKVSFARTHHYQYWQAQAFLSRYLLSFVHPQNVHTAWKHITHCTSNTSTNYNNIHIIYTAHHQHVTLTQQSRERFISESFIHSYCPPSFNTFEHRYVYRLNFEAMLEKTLIFNLPILITRP